MAMKTKPANVGTTRYGITHIPQAGKGKRIYVLPGAFYGSCVALFASAGFERADDIDDADVVAFIGGVDVDPALYGQQKIPQTQTPQTSRDTLEKAVYDKCVSMKKPMVGICRGAQFLHVMNGGSLWQDVSGHAGNDHLIYDIDEDVTVEVTSYHHQMLALPSVGKTELDIIAVCPQQISKRFQNDSMVLNIDRTENDNDVELEIEAGAYWDTRCFFVQGHPEVGSDEYKSWFMHKVHDFLTAFDLDDETTVHEPVFSEATIMNFAS